MEKIRNAALSTPVCFFMLAAAIIFGNGIMYLFGNDPASPVGTLSLLCEDRKYLFWIWAFFVGGGFYLNILYAYRKYRENARFLRILCLFGLLAVCGIGLSLKHDITTWNPKRIVHWVSTGMYMAAIGFSLFLFFVRNRKRYKGFTALSVLVVAVACGIVTWLFTIGKNGYLEMVPATVLQFLLMAINFIVPVRERRTE